MTLERRLQMASKSYLSGVRTEEDINFQIKCLLVKTSDSQSVNLGSTISFKVIRHVPLTLSSSDFVVVGKQVQKCRKSSHSA